MLLAFLPVLSFFSILVANAHNVPQMDDYDALLGFLNRYLSTQGGLEKLRYFITAQHVQYKLWFEHAILLAEYAVTGKVNFVFLQQLGNSFVLLIAGVLWLLFRAAAPTFQRNVALFCPVIFLLFAPRYEETLDWAMAGLQNLPVIFFSLLSIYLSGKASRSAFAGSCVAGMLAIASSLNGFVGAFAGFLFLLQQRRYRRAACSALLASVALALYADKYKNVAIPVVAHHSAWFAVPMFFGFLGSALGKAAAIPFGVVLLATFAVLAWRFRTRNPTILYAIGFVLLTAAGIAISRHDGGLSAAFSSRYTIYSNLLMVLLYLAALQAKADQLQPHWDRPVRGAFFIATLLFCVASQYLGFRTLHRRTQALETHYRGWLDNPRQISLLPDESPEMEAREMKQFQEHAAAVLEEARAHHLYGMSPY